MANGFKHASQGTVLTQTEYEAEDTHVLDSQATGDVIYASSSTVLRRLAVGSTGAVLTVTGGVPVWDTTWTPTGHLIPAADDSYDLGSAAAAWQDLFLEGDITLTDAGTISTTAGSLSLTPASGSAIVLDGTISIDAGVVTGATSITSTAFAGALTGNVTGNASGTAATVTTAAQGNITSLGTLTTLTVDNVIVNGTTIGHTSDTDLLTLTSANLAVAGDLEVSGSVEVATIDYTDGDNAITIADGGGVTFAQSLTVTGATVLNGAVTLGSAADDVITINGTVSGASAVIFEGTASVSETSLDVVNPTADATIKLPAMSAGTYFLPVLDTVSTTAISSTPEELNLLAGVSGLAQADFTKLAALEATAAEIELLDGSAKSTASITIADADAFIVIDGTTTKQIPASDIKTYVGDTDTTYSPGALLDLSGTTFAVDLTEAAAATVAAADYVLFLDGGTTGTQSKGNIHDVATLFAGAGMTATSSVMNVIGGTGITANNDEIVITPAQTTITSIYATDLIIGEDAQTAIDFGTENEIDFKINNAAELTLDASSLYPITDVGLNLGSTAQRFQTLYGQQFHMDASIDGIADNSYSGMSATLRVGDGAAVAAWDLVCISDVTNELEVADADAVAKSRVIGINPLNATIADNAEGVILFHGFVRNDAWGWTPGATLYLHTAGTGDTISETAPSGTDDCVVVIGVALEADMIYFNPSGTVIEHA